MLIYLGVKPYRVKIREKTTVWRPVSLFYPLFLWLAILEAERRLSLAGLARLLASFSTIFGLRTEVGRGEKRG